MKVAFQMEPMAETIRDETHSLVMIEEACARGHNAFHYHPDTLTLDNQGLWAMAAPVSVDLSRDDYFTLGPYAKTDLSGFDAVFFRQDPPFNMPYVTSTYMLDFLSRRGVLLVNNPFWIRNMPDKLSIFDFPEFLPPTLVTREKAEIEAFFEKHQDVVIKPLYGFHGHGVVRAKSAMEAQAALRESAEPLMLQPFLKEIERGNTRIVFFDGEIAGALRSVPQDGKEFRIFRNSIDESYTPNARELELCEKLGPLLKERGLIFVGIDLIGPYLTEINVGSVGSLRRLNKIYGGKSEARLWDVIERKIATRK